MVTHTAVAVYEYVAVNADELSFSEGERITVTGKNADGWWHGFIGADRQGVFPSNYVEEQ